MTGEYYREYFNRYVDSTEEDAIKAKCGVIEMEIMQNTCTDANDLVAHQASIVLGLNVYKNRKDDYIQEICYSVCTAECDIQKVMDRCNEILSNGYSCELEDDISTLCRLLMLADRQPKNEPLGYICEELLRSYIVHDKPEYEQLSSNIDYILYDLLDVLDLATDEGKKYVYKHKEQFIRPIMDLTLSTGDMLLMGQMKQIYSSWMEWR